VNTLIAVESLKPLAAGSRLQEFVIERVLGMGGFGVVYLARDTLLNRTVAIKEYMPNHMVSRVDGLTVTLKSEAFAQDFETGKAGFINEARMLARFKHPALIEVFRFWEQNCTAYMATPFYDGCTFKEYLSNRQIKLDETVLKGILFPVLDALQHMHQEKVYHRDISPDNIMILTDGRPILLDLGAARAVEVESAQALTVLVKPGYAPIEQYGGDSGRDQGPWTDIYGVGASAYFALVGKPPPPSASRVMRDSIIKLSELSLSGFSVKFLNAMDAALAVRPDDRPQTISALKALLQSSIPEKVEAPLVPEVTRAASANDRPDTVSSKVAIQNVKTPSLKSGNKKSSRVVVLVSLVVVGLIGVFAWLALPSPRSSVSPRPAQSTPPISVVKVDEARAPVVPLESISKDSPSTALPAVETLKVPANQADLEVSVKAIAEKPNEAADKPAVARLFIKPWGEIFVNNESRGVSPPLKALSLPAGNYTIEVRNSDYPTYKKNVSIKAGETIRINHAFTDHPKK
jgi:serine/threonine protein kinase